MNLKTKILKYLSSPTEKKIILSTNLALSYSPLKAPAFLCSLRSDFTAPQRKIKDEKITGQSNDVCRLIPHFSCHKSKD